MLKAQKNLPEKRGLFISKKSKKAHKVRIFR